MRDLAAQIDQAQKECLLREKKDDLFRFSLAYPRSLNRLGILFKIKEIIYDA